ncbi:hypothetical protein GCM10027429_33510 [Marivirga atlantica]|jgi:hypothetical protein|uniref:PepSY domain-containing protein n=2 Tax=Marivirga TaxID=869806 RepID=A0A2T4DFR3_9BACT|nr:hypothetical protein [Marivirga atlantica]MBL0766928.1 hypothetical protein [Marivirga atlantica]PTB92626.1 hypothetical protein C9994_13765 [Marivirga lumbricoides]RUA33643.1 MAG: hypothetical protein DSY77_09225 [Bacteroidota bacterium]GGC56230.1 hypothetical protein GCM10011506_47410 [Marivirga lumbricoides]
MRKNNQYYVRKTHRWLGVIIGVQFLFWTISGLYFSWTDIDEIHGDHFIEEHRNHTAAIGILPILDSTVQINDISLRFIGEQSYFFINDSLLIHSQTGLKKNGVTKKEAESIARKHVIKQYEIKSSEMLTEVGSHHEYRGRPLPVWEIEFDSPENLTAYVSQRDGSFQRVRHRAWRWFDFLWMSHTMDYEGRDDFNNWLLRIFSVFGLLTVLSGFTLFFMTNKKRIKKKAL